MQTVTRWKIACMLLTAAVGGLAVRAHGTRRNIAAPQVSVRSGAIPLALRRPLRMTAGSVGISERDLIERILAAKSVRDVQLLCEKLAVVGTDDAVEALAGMLADPRFGVPAAILGTFAAIGTERGIAIVIQAASDDRPSVQMAAITALGESQSAKAEQLLLDIAAKAGDPAQDVAIASLGRFSSDRAIAKLVELANSNDYLVASAAVSALGSARTPTATTALRKLLDAPDSRIVAAALGAIDTVDDEVFGKINAIMRTGTPQLVEAALGALANKGDAALPMLRDAALHGFVQARWSAIQAIGAIGGDGAVEALGEIMNTSDRRSAQAAAALLAQIGGSQARELLIGAALSDRAQLTGALTHLSQLSGDDVDQALLSVVRQGTGADRQAALPKLVKSGNAEAMQVAIHMATQGSAKERRDAVEILAESRSPRAFDALVGIAEKAHGSTRSDALAALVQARPTDPTVARLLSEALRSGSQDQMAQAAGLLARTGTPAARLALVSALSGKDASAAMAATRALGELGVTDEVKAALLSAASSDRRLKLEVMTQLVGANASEGLSLAREIIDGKDAAAASRAVWVVAQQDTAEAKQLVDRALASTEPAVRAAALSSAATEGGGEHSVDTLLRFVHDTDAQVRATALSQLGQLGSDRAQSTLLAAARQGASEDRVVAINSLANLDDARTTSELTNFMRDPDPGVAIAAISASSQVGPEVESQLIRIINDSGVDEQVKVAAAAQLRDRRSTLDPSTQAVVERLAGAPEMSEADLGSVGILED